VRRLLPLLLLLSLLPLGIGCATTGLQARVGFVELDQRQRPHLLLTDARLRLTSPVGKELAALPDARVKAWGTLVGASMRVQHYQVLDAGNGFMAYVGWIIYDQSGVRLKEWLNGREWTLVGEGVRDLREWHGNKVWITGLEDGPDEIRPLAWGRLD